MSHNQAIVVEEISGDAAAASVWGACGNGACFVLVDVRPDSKILAYQAQPDWLQRAHWVRGVAEQKVRLRRRSAALASVEPEEFIATESGPLQAWVTNDDGSPEKVELGISQPLQISQPCLTESETLG